MTSQHLSTAGLGTGDSGLVTTWPFTSPQSPFPSPAFSLSAQFHKKPDVFFHQSGNIIFAALQLCLRSREGDDDRYVPVPHQASDLIFGPLQEVLVHREEPVID